MLVYDNQVSLKNVSRSMNKNKGLLFLYHLKIKLQSINRQLIVQERIKVLLYGVYQYEHLGQKGVEKR